MSRPEYWIWLSMVLGPGARTADILSAYPDPEKLYSESRMERTMSGLFQKSRLDRMESVKLSEAENYISVCNKNGWKVITPDMEEYPGSLRNLIDMPLVLFCDGDLSCLEGRISIGVVGTRNPTYEGVKIAKKLAGDMAESGAVIVSGGALGIDSAAHEGALQAGKPTVCVLGCGLGTRYLMTNAVLRSEIAKCGALVTEYPPFSEAGRTTFPLRNRIISGLSDGVLVVEAGEKSGSLITARYALEQGREVFAVPGSILSGSYTGANRLIRDGARAITCADDIISPFAPLYPGITEKSSGSADMKSKPKHVRKIIPQDIEGDTLAVYKLLSDEPLHSDEICALSGLSPSKVMAALTELEISGYIEQTEGKNYVLS